jgi:hypothetical protein
MPFCRFQEISEEGSRALKLAYCTSAISLFTWCFPLQAKYQPPPLSYIFLYLLKVMEIPFYRMDFSRTDFLNRQGRCECGL